MTQTITGAVVALAVVIGLGVVRQRSAPPPAVIVADNGAALTEVAIQFDPTVVAEVGDTYRDLLTEIPASVVVHVIVNEAADYDRFMSLVDEWHVADRDRFRPVEVGRRITTWSRDRYTLVERGDRAVLLVPPRPNRGNEARENDWHAPFALAAEADEVDAEIAELIFDGGDMTATATHVFATAVLRERNHGGDLYDLDALRGYLRRHTGKAPVILGETAADVPGHHIGMFVTPLDERRVLVGDPDVGIALFAASAADPAALPLPIDRRDDSLQRFRNVANQLEARGFEVIRAPLVPLVDGLTYVTYNNALLEHRDGALHAYVPQFGLDSMDAAGRAAYEDAGVVVHPIRVDDVYRYNGTVRCLVNVVSRAPM